MSRPVLLAPLVLASAIGFAAYLLLSTGNRASPPTFTATTDDAGFFFRPGLYLYDRNTGDVRRLAEEAALDVYRGYAPRTFAWADGRIVHTSIDYDDPHVSVTDVRTGQTLSAPGRAYEPELAADGRVRASILMGSGASEVSGLGFINAESGQIEDFAQGSFSGQLSPDGQWLATSSGQGIAVVDVSSRKIQAELNGSYAYHLSWSPDGKRLAVARLKDSTAFVWEWSSGNVTELGPGAVPLWSPDGNTVALTRYETPPAPDLESSTASVWVRTADGSKPARRLGQGEFPAWSPDGQSIAVIRDDGIFEVRARDGRARPLVEIQLPVLYEPRYSPDGRYLAFRAGGGPSLILTVDVDTAVETIVGLGLNPVWSPDGSRIAFMYGHDPQGVGIGGSVYTMAPDGGDIARLGPFTYGDQLPACPRGAPLTWSSDGAKVMWWTDSNHQALIVPAAGGVATVLERAGGGSWSPDGRVIAYTSLVRRSRDDPCSVALALSDGTNLGDLVPGAADPSWSPDGRWLAVQRSPLAGSRSHAQVLLVAGLTAVRAIDFGEGSVLGWLLDGRLALNLRGPDAEGAGLAPGVAFINPDTLGRTDLALPPNAQQVRFSPDGSSVAYVVGQLEVSTMWVASLSDLAHPRRLTEGHSPSWSPDGKRIVFARSRART